MFAFDILCLGGVFVAIPVILIVAVLLIYVLVMARIEYKSLAEVKQRNENKKHDELHETESFEKQELQYVKQGSPLNWPSILIASIVYKLRHPNNNTKN